MTIRPKRLLESRPLGFTKRGSIQPSHWPGFVVTSQPAQPFGGKLDAEARCDRYEHPEPFSTEEARMEVMEAEYRLRMMNPPQEEEAQEGYGWDS